MTEAEWLACEDSIEVLRGAPGLLARERFSLWWLACCRHRWAALSGREKAAIEKVERLRGTPSPELSRKFAGAMYTASRSRPNPTAEFARLLREVFGNPFRPVSFNPAWRTDTAVSLARGMYDSRNFGAMPILADALQDVGCEDEQILNHCRDATAPHVRGCWVCDLVLGKN
jgi:hypothetical protein